MKIEAGCVVADRFRLVRLLGGGGMGEVWAAHDMRLDMPCAVKFLRGATLDAPEARSRFEREAKAAAHLRSPHVVQILDHGESLGVPYIAMELLEGEDLANRLRRVGRLGLAETASIVAQIAKALTRAQAISLIHRDLKPANVFLVRDDPGEIVKVLDFGIAKSLAADSPESARSGAAASPAKGVTQAGILMGTPTYMSPEQIAGEPIDERADLWSLAVVAFECLTGEPPFTSDNIGELFLKIQSAPLPKPSDRVPALPAALDAWFVKAAARTRNDRFPTARALSDAFDSAAGLPGREGAANGGTSLHPSARGPSAFEATQPTLEPVATDGGPPSSVVSPTGSTRALGVTQWMVGAHTTRRRRVRAFVGIASIGIAVLVVGGGTALVLSVGRAHPSSVRSNVPLSPIALSASSSTRSSETRATRPSGGRIVQIGAGDTHT